MIIMRTFFLLFCISVVGFGVQSQEMKTIKASDPHIQYIGRFDDSDPDSLVFSYSGTSIRTSFNGGRIDALFTELGEGDEKTSNYFNVIIDGGEPSLLKLEPSKTVYTLATDLAEGKHSIELFKRTESQVGNVAFRGFQIKRHATLERPAPLPQKKMLFIGNSITCGYGNEISTTDPGNYHFTSKNENNYLAWGAITARKLNAQYHCVAYSGRGLMQNNTGTRDTLIPDFFDQVLPGNESLQWDHSKYIPDIVVINAGTNDFFAESINSNFTVSEEAFVAAYINFIADIRSKYKNASIICALGVMMSDYYPPEGKHWTRIQEYVQKAVDAFTSKGDDKVFLLKMNPQSAPYGEDWHPTVATHQKMAASLTEFIDNQLK